MHLILTRYIDRSPEDVEAVLASAVPGRLDDPMVDDPLLDGSEIRIGGIDGLTELKVAVPWSADDAKGHKLLVANRYTETVAMIAQAAA